MSEFAGKSINYFEGTAIMVNTAIGGGISLIATPAGLRHLGIFWFIITEMICCFFTFISLYVLCCVADQIKRPRLELQENKPNSYKISQLEELMIFPQFPSFSKQIVNIAVIMNCLGVDIAFLSIIHDILKDITDNNITNIIVLTFIYLLFIMFAIFVDNPKKMGYASKIAASLWIIFMILLGYNAIYAQFINPNSKHNSQNTDNNNDSSFGVGIGISNVVLSWISQFQILTVFNSIKDGQQNIHTMTYKVILPMVLTLFSVYVIEGIFCFWSFGYQHIYDDITKNIYVIHQSTNTFIIHSGFAIVAALCLGLAQLISVPLFFLHFKEETLSFLNTLGFEVMLCENKTIIVNKNEKLLNETEENKENIPKKKWKYFVTSIGIIITISFTLTIKDVEIIIGYIGTLTSAIGWLFPPCIYMLAVHGSNKLYRYQHQKRILLYIYSIISIILWLVLLPIGLIADSE